MMFLRLFVISAVGATLVVSQPGKIELIHFDPLLVFEKGTGCPFSEQRTVRVLYSIT